MSYEKSAQVDEAVWQAWLKKNKAHDQMRRQRRFRVMAIGTVLFGAGVLFWTTVL